MHLKKTQNTENYSIPAERALLGSILIEPKIAGEIIQRLNSKDFYEPKHSVIFSALAEMFMQETPIDLLTLSQKLKNDGTLKTIGGRSYLAELTEETPTSSHALEYAKIVREKADIRVMVEAGQMISGAAMTKGSAEAEEGLINALKTLQDRKIQLEKTFDETCDAVLESIKDGTINGIPCGISGIDRNSRGYKAGQIWIIGAAPGGGKTTVAIELMLRLCKKHQAIFYSLEMSSEEIIEKMLHIEEKKRGKISAVERVRKIGEKLAIFESKFSLTQIEAHLLSQTKKPPVVFIDYVQLIQATTRSGEEYQEMTKISRSLKRLAKRAGVCIVALSQLNKVGINRGEITTSFKGTGAWGEDANVGIEISKEKDQSPDNINVYFNLKKNRHGRPIILTYEFDNVNNLFLFDDDLEKNQAVALALPEEKLDDLLPVF